MLQGIQHLVIQDQIRRHDVHIAGGRMDHVQVHFLAHPLVIQRAVGVGQHVTVGLQSDFFQILYNIIFEGIQIFFRDIPHLQKHQRKAHDRIAVDHHRRILPVAETHLLVDVLVGQIDAAGERHLAVHDEDFPVIPVVLAGGKHGLQRHEHLALDAPFFHFLRIIMGQQGKTAGAVVHEPHLHALLHLSLQDFQNGVPHHTGRQDKIF